MRHQLSIGLFVCLGLIACAQEEPKQSAPENRPSVEASASVDKAIATTGDVITYRVTLNHRTNVVVDLPEVGSEIAGLRIIDFGRDKAPETDERVEVTAWYQLRGDLVGSYILPSIKFPSRKAPALTSKEEPSRPPKYFSKSKVFCPKTAVPRIFAA